MTAGIPLRSFFMAGFECSSHRRPDGVRLDLLESSGHCAHAALDYRSCADLGLLTIRDGLRWHLIEHEAGRYDWSSWVPMLESAAEAGVQVIWDLFHYGSPDNLDQAAPDLPERFARFAAEAVHVHRAVTGAPALVCPINEISFFTWAVRTGYFPRVGRDEQGWFKRHLAGAAIAAARAIRAADPGCRFVWAEPLIHIAPPRKGGYDPAAVEDARLSQFEALDMIGGRLAPELGGSPDLVDLVGLNFYPDNQWYHGGSTIALGQHDFRPLSAMLAEVAARYGKPVFLSETGAEGSARPAWLHYVCDEVAQALVQGVPVRGICLYPVTVYPHWDDSRPSQVGLFGAPDEGGRRSVYEPVAAELERQRARFAPFFDSGDLRSGGLPIAALEPI